MPGIWGHGKNKMPLPRMAVSIKTEHNSRSDVDVLYVGEVLR